MAKPLIQQLIISNTFQELFDLTNQITAIIKQETITASSVGDTTGTLVTPLRATLYGVFTSTEINATADLKTNNISGLTGSDVINISSKPTVVFNSSTDIFGVQSALGPKMTFSDGIGIWKLGFAAANANTFMITTGAGQDKFSFSSSGNLSVLGSISAASIVSDLTGNSDSATILATPRIISSSGDVNWSVSFDGSANISGTATIQPNTVTSTKIRQSPAYSIMGRASNTTGNIGDIVATADGQILRRSGTSISFGALSLSSPAAVSGVLPVANGGTGTTNLIDGRILIGNGTENILTTSRLFWDNINFRLGINTSTPTEELHVIGDVFATGTIKTATGFFVSSVEIVDAARNLKNINVDVTSAATNAQALAGLNNTKIMTPIRTAEAITDLAPKVMGALIDNDVGSYAFLGVQNGVNVGNIYYGDIVSGTLLKPAGMIGNNLSPNNEDAIRLQDTINAPGKNYAITGNWRCMGWLIGTAGSADVRSATLFLRVS